MDGRQQYVEYRRETSAVPSRKSSATIKGGMSRQVHTILCLLYTHGIIGGFLCVKLMQMFNTSWPTFLTVASYIFAASKIQHSLRSPVLRERGLGERGPGEPELTLTQQR